jgi:hypothetical protein
MRDFDPTASEFISSGYIETSRPGGRLHDPFTAIAGIGSALIGSDAAGDAADTLVSAANSTNKTNKYIFDKQVELQQPFRESGLTANNRLMELMGLSVPQKTEADWRAELLKDYTTNGGFLGKAQTIDEKGLTAAIAEKMAAQQAPQQSADFGSLMETFNASKMYEDPGYQFRLAEGQKGVENSAAARGGLLSGAAMKAMQKYSQDYASNEYGNAYGRFNSDQTNKYNRLAGLVNTGMGATNQIGNAAGQYGQNVASANAAMGNAQAAGSVGQANALMGGISQGVNAYQNNQLMSMIRNPGTSTAQPPIASYYGY